MEFEENLRWWVDCLGQLTENDPEASIIGTKFLFFTKFPLPSTTFLLPYQCSGIPAAN